MLMLETFDDCLAGQLLSADVANIADGGTWDDVSVAERLKAEWREPRLPEWVVRLWQSPVVPC